MSQRLSKWAEVMQQFSSWQQFSICPEMNIGAGQVGQDFGQTGAFRFRPALAETEGVKGLRQAGIRLNLLVKPYK